MAIDLSPPRRMERSGTLGNFKRWPRSEGAAESLRRGGYRNSFQGDLDCGGDLLWPRISPLPLFQSSANNNMYSQGSATLHPPRRTEVSCTLGAEDPNLILESPSRAPPKSFNTRSTCPTNNFLDSSDTGGRRMLLYIEGHLCSRLN